MKGGSTEYILCFKSGSGIARKEIEMPIDPQLTELSDAGEFGKARNPYLDAALETIMLLKIKEKKEQ